MQNGNDDSNDGSGPAITPDSQPSLTSSQLPDLLLGLTQQIAEQNRALWALIEQTAALIEIVAESATENDEEPTHYLDGTPIA